MSFTSVLLFIVASDDSISANTVELRLETPGPPWIILQAIISPAKKYLRSRNNDRS